MNNNKRIDMPDLRNGWIQENKSGRTQALPS